MYFVSVCVSVSAFKFTATSYNLPMGKFSPISFKVFTTGKSISQLPILIANESIRKSPKLVSSFFNRTQERNKQNNVHKNG